MTVSNTENEWSYAGDGVTVAFQYENKIFASSDLEVYLDQVLQSSGYTVSGVGVPAGGLVTFAVAPAAGVAVKIVRNVPQTQPTDYITGGEVDLESIEAGFDRGVIFSQQLLAEHGKQLGLQPGDPASTIGNLPLKSTLANQILGFDGAGDPIAIEPTDASAQAVTATGSPASRLLAERFAEVINVKDYGAAGDGVTDDTAAIQAAIDAFRSAVDTSILTKGQPPTLLFPPAPYLTADTLDFTSIRAVNWTVFAYGALIYAKTTGKPVIDMLDCRFWRIKGLTIFGDAISKPTYGIQFGRIDGTSAGDATFEDVHIEGNFTVAPMYNYAAETVDYRHVRLYNSDTAAGSYSLIMDGANWQGITSAFVTQTNAVGTAQSFNDQVFLGCDFRKETSGGVILMQGNFNHHHYLNCYGAATSDQLIYIYKATAIDTLVLDIHAETTGVDESLLVDTTDAAATVVITNLKIKDHAAHADVALIDITGSTRQLVMIGFLAEFGHTQNAVPLFGTGGGVASKILVQGTIIWASDSRTLDLSNCYFDGQIMTGPTTAIIETLGTYQIIRRPDSSDARIMEIKGRLRIRGTHNSATANNYLEVAGGTTGNPEINAGGTSADIDIPLAPKGTGRVRFGTHTALGAETVTGYVEIKDAAGTVRKIAVVS